VNDAEQLFPKWQGWIKDGLLMEFQRLLRDQRIFNAFLESLNPFVGQLEGAEIAAWIGMNYFLAACVAIRRLDDSDKRSISLRILLRDLHEHADVLTETTLAAHNPMFRVTPGIKVMDTGEVRDVLSSELALMDQFGQKIKVYVNKFVAHKDTGITESMIPKSLVLDKAIFCFHALFRKYAFLIGGIPCNFNNPDPLDLISAPSEDYKKRLTCLWAK
jgi:hypothetical protein